jgi:N-acetylmuramoyl-L-alanine amidase
MSYPITVNLINGLPHIPYRNGVGCYEGVVAHSTATPDATAGAERVFESTHYTSAFVHFFVDWTQILQVADMNYLSWGAGPGANPRFVNVELCESSDPAKFKESYARYTYILAYILFKRKLGVKHLATLWTHQDVTTHFGGTDHQDPVAYLKSHGVTVDQLVADVTAQYNLLATPPRKTYVIKDGDTLYGISKDTGVSVQTIQKLNPTLKPTALTIGAKIYLS